MPGFYMDGGTPVEVLEFGIPGAKTDNTDTIITAPQGFVTKIKVLHINVAWNTAINGERGFWPRFISPTGALLFDVIGGDDYYGGATFAPPSPLNISYATNAGTPTFSTASNVVNLAQVNITILPDIWIEAGTRLVPFCQNFQAGDNIGAISGLIELREDIGRSGFGGNPLPSGESGSDAWLLYSA